MDLRNCDNMELMAEFPDNYFDLAIVDPPYGINADSKNNGKNSEAHERTSKARINTYKKLIGIMKRQTLFTFLNWNE